MKIDCLNKSGFKETEQVILGDENKGAVELWNAFVAVSAALSDFEDMGCDIGNCYKALSVILHKVNEPVNKRLIAQWLDEGKFETKGIEDCDQVILELNQSIKELDETMEKVHNEIQGMVDDKDYPAETI